MKKRNPHRSVVLGENLSEALTMYAVKNHISGSEAIRQFIDKGLSVTSYEQNQNEIRKYIREEIEIVITVVMKRYMDRLIKLQAQAARTSAAALQCTVAVLAENYIDTATPEEILASALRQSTRITMEQVKSDEDYLREAHEWLDGELSKPNDM